MIKNSMKPWHLWVVGLLMIFIYINGVYDFIMMLSHNTNYYESKGYGEAVYRYFTDYPLIPLIFWMVNISTGLLAGLIIWINISWARKLALISGVSMALLQLITFSFMDRWNILGPFISIFDLVLLILTFGFYGYCRRQNEILENKTD